MRYDMKLSNKGLYSLRVLRHLAEGSEVEVDGTAGVVIRIDALVGVE